MSGPGGAILITRPRDQAQELASELEALGYQCLIEPLLEIETKAAAWPRSPDEYGGIIITSRHAVPPEARGKTAHMPLYVVGEVVAETARTKGFKNIVTCAPTAQKLYNHMALNRADYTQPLLYLRGADTAFPMAESLQEIGVDCEEAEVYVSHPAQAFSPSTRAALQGGDIGAVTLFSARTARIFTELYVREVNAVRPSLTLLCFSDSVLECVRSLNMEQAYSCAEPTRAAMIKLIRQHIPRTHRPQQGARHMTQTQNNDTLGNAEEIIERFGGIRPMSTKTNIPVTTIQGWKKRGAIPAARLDDLLKAAKSHDVKLEDLLEKTGAPANQNGGSAEKAEKPAAKAEAPVSVRTEPQKISVSQPAYTPAQDSYSSGKASGGDHEKLQRAIVAERQKALVQSIVISAVLILTITAVGAIMLWPEFEDTARVTRENSQSIAALEQDVTAVKGEMEQQKSMFSGYLPGDWQQQMDELRAQAEAAQASVQQAMQQAGEISNDMAQDVLGADAGTIQQRVASLGEHLSSLTSSPMLQGLMGKYSALGSTPEGESMLDSSVAELNALLQSSSPVEGVPGAPAEETLEAARAQSTVLGQTFDGVPADDLKAAALLLGFSQFRSSLGRDNESFAEDVSLLKNLLGQDNPALSEAIDRLAPNAAEQGVLTPGGLTSELQAMTGDIVVASLKGEDVSVAEKAQARFGEILKVEKDGQLLTGTPVQQKLSQTESLMQNGQLEEAIAVASTLEGPAGEMIGPWLQKARRTLQAQNLGLLLEGGIAENLSGAADAVSGNGLPAGGRLIEDPESGIILYRPGTKFAPPVTP